MEKDASHSGRNAWLQRDLRDAKRRVSIIRDGVITDIEAATEYHTGGNTTSDDEDASDWDEPF